MDTDESKIHVNIKVVADDCTCSISVCNFTVGLSLECFPFNWMWQLCYEVSCGNDL